MRGGSDHQSYALAIELLCDPMRREVLAFLVSEFDGPIRLDDLASELAEDGHRTERYMTELYHVHLPKLAAVGLVEFDADRRLISGRDVHDIQALIALFHQGL